MNKDKYEKDLKIAALGGVGLSLAEIARETDVSRGRAQYVLETKVENNRHGLGDVYDQFREEMRPVLQNIVRIALGKLYDKIQGKNVEIRDLVAVYNIVAAQAGLTANDGSSTVTRTQTATVDIKNPANLKAMREALSTERAEQTKALASENG